MQYYSAYMAYAKAYLQSQVESLPLSHDEIFCEYELVQSLLPWNIMRHYHENQLKICQALFSNQSVKDIKPVEDPFQQITKTTSHTPPQQTRLEQGPLSTSCLVQQRDQGQLSHLRTKIRPQSFTKLCTEFDRLTLKKHQRHIQMRTSHREALLKQMREDFMNMNY